MTDATNEQRDLAIYNLIVLPPPASLEESTPLFSDSHGYISAVSEHTLTIDEVHNWVRRHDLTSNAIMGAGGSFMDPETISLSYENILHGVFSNMPIHKRMANRVRGWSESIRLDFNRTLPFIKFYKVDNKLYFKLD